VFHPSGPGSAPLELSGFDIQGQRRQGGPQRHLRWSGRRKLGSSGECGGLGYSTAVDWSVPEIPLDWRIGSSGGGGQCGQGGAEGDGGFGVGVDGHGAAEFGGDELGDERDSGGAADEQDRVEVVGVDVG
jgi:hypothetical protein